MKQSIKTLLIMAAAACLCTNLSAQTQVQGRILEAAGEPLAFANILLLTATDSTFMKGEISAEDGTFTFAQLSPGNYRCEVSMVGFARKFMAAYNQGDHATIQKMYTSDAIRIDTEGKKIEGRQTLEGGDGGGTAAAEQRGLISGG